jgi:phosphoribosylanthranilate isomerase
MGFKVKVCGLRHPDNILRIGALYPDFMGFIFYPQSPRYVGDDFRIPEGLPEQIKRVGVFVNASVESILKAASENKLDYIQLHGYESADLCALLYGHGHRIIKAIHFDSSFRADRWEPYSRYVDYFLLDTPSEQFGGSGKRFDWSLIDQYQLNKPFFLSGGLSVEVLKESILPAHRQLEALDVNSGVEHAPGVKDEARVQAFIQFSKYNL